MSRCIGVLAGVLLAAAACTGPNPRYELRELPPADGPAAPDAGPEVTSDAPALPEDGPADAADPADMNSLPDAIVPVDTAPADTSVPADTSAPADTSSPVDVSVPADAPADMAPPELVAGLLGYWRFDDDPDGTRSIRDSSGRNNNGAFEGSATGTGFITTGRFGRAFELTAPDRDFGIRVSANTELRSLQRYTLAAWVLRRRSVPLEYCGIISRQIDGQDGEVFNMMVSKDYLKAYGPDRDSASGSVTTATVPEAVPLNDWFHAAATFDGSKIRIYFNGVERHLDDWTAPLPSGGSAPIYLATKKVINWAHPFIGALDDVMLYDRALPPEAIMALAQGIRPSVP